MSIRSFKTLMSWTVAGAVALSIGACDEKKQAKTESTVSSATPSGEPTEQPEPLRMPQVTITQQSVQLGLDSLRWNAPSFDKFLEAKLKKLPASMPDAVICNVDRKVKTPKVVKVVTAVFDAGAKAIEVRTKPRGTFPSKLLLTSQKSLGGKVPGCTYVAMILDNLKATFWHVRGGLAKTYTKGMAGPDLSAMHEVMHKESSTCHSTVFLFSAEKNVDWGHTFDLGVSVGAHQPPYKDITKYVLLENQPVPGKPVKLGR